MQKYYLDASIWRDYYENRSDKFRPLGEWALLFLNSVIDHKDFILYSDLVVHELAVKYSEKEIGQILMTIMRHGLLIKVRISKGQAYEAKKLSKEKNVPFADAIHAILARDNCAILVTRDKHFNCVAHLIDVRKPEELI